MISIITATYNSQNTIAQTLESALSQTYKDIEYIVVDGGSTDNTLDIIKKYEPSFEGKLHCISEPDRGIYDAFNKGIRMATGDIVGILNSDDHFTTNDVLECVVNNIEGYDAVYADVHFEKPGNKGQIVRYYSSEMFRPFWLRFGFMPAHPSFYVRKKIYDKVGLYSLDYKIASDFDMMVRMFHNHHIKAKYIKKDFVTMLTGGMSTKNYHNRLLITKEDVKACRRNGLYTNLLMIACKYFYKILEYTRVKRFA